MQRQPDGLADDIPERQIHCAEGSQGSAPATQQHRIPEHRRPVCLDRKGVGVHDVIAEEVAHKLRNQVAGPVATIAVTGSRHAIRGFDAHDRVLRHVSR